ncbi:MAG TPA: lamin tail domain-containing protein [Chthoniobacteraceae bacterium]|jgi:hypothetical protein
MKHSLLSAVLLTGALASAQSAIVITEVHPTGNNASYAADWFELTNNGASAVNITGWKIDDSSASFASALALRGVTNIASGASVIFLEGIADGTTDSTIATNFRSAWFGANPPAGLMIGGYGGSGAGLGNSGDAVNIYDSTGTLVANVSFLAATTGTTFDNPSGANGAVTTKSVSGVNGAFTSPGGEIGSPGAVPEPGSATLLFGAIAGIAALRRRRSA